MIAVNEKSMFGQVFLKLIQQVNCFNDEKLSAIKKDFEISNVAELNIRNGIQSKIAVFFESVKNRIQTISNEKLTNVHRSKFIAKVFESLSLYYYQSVKKNRGINYPSVNSLENLMGSFVENIPKANENFTSFILKDKKLSLKTTSELSAFIALVAVLFQCDILKLEEIVVDLLRSQVKIFINNKDFVAEINKQLCNFKFVIDQIEFDATDTMQQADKLLHVQKEAVLLGKLIFILLYFTDYKSPTTEAKEEYIGWINNIQDYFVKVCNGYSKYLWIRYRRLPGADMSLEMLNGLTIDNVYVLPDFLENNQKVDGLLSACFNKNEQKRTRKAIVASYGKGKTSLLHLIISCIVVNSNYAIKYENISRYFMNVYNDYNQKLQFHSRDVFPIVINCEKFSAYAKSKNNQALSLTDFAYYIIKQYNEDLNIVGERNKGWYDNWIVTFSNDEFVKILDGAIEEDKLMLLVDSVDCIEDNYKILFEKMLNEFIHTYGCSCEIILTAGNQKYLPQSVVDEKYGFDIVHIADLSLEQAKQLLLNYYTFYKSSDLVTLKKQELLEEFERMENPSYTKNCLDQKFENYNHVFEANKSVVLALFNELKSNEQMSFILKNPYMLTRIAKLYVKSDFDIKSLLKDVVYDSLPIMSEMSEPVYDFIQKDFFKAAVESQALGNYEPVYKLYKKLDSKGYANMDVKLKNLIKTTKTLLKLLLESKQND